MVKWEELGGQESKKGDSCKRRKWIWRDLVNGNQKLETLGRKEKRVKVKNGQPQGPHRAVEFWKKKKKKKKLFLLTFEEYLFSAYHQSLSPVPVLKCKILNNSILQQTVINVVCETCYNVFLECYSFVTFYSVPMLYNLLSH